MADISSLTNLAPAEPLDLNTYKDVKASTFQLPKEGRYVVRAAEITSASFGASRAGALTAQIDPTIMGPTNEGFQLRFVRVSDKAYQRDGQAVSQMGDYLRACGIRGALSTPQEKADAVESTSGQTFTVDLVWKAENRASGFVLKGMKNFPADGNGGHQSWCLDPTDKDENGNPVRVLARLEIARYIPAE